MSNRAQRLAEWRDIRLEYALHVAQCDDPDCRAEVVLVAALVLAFEAVLAAPPAAPAVGEA